jgi:hypothetical protein
VNGFFLLVLVMCIGAGVIARWLHNLDGFEAHLLHGPQSGCAECASK